jgi:hypothetical protein
VDFEVTDMQAFLVCFPPWAGSGHALNLAAGLLAKRFSILSGSSGSGKTRLGLLISRWFCRNLFREDPFLQGAKILSERISYHIHDSDRLAVEFWNSDMRNEATRVTLPREMIHEWADWIAANGGTRDQLVARQIREGVKKSSAFSDQLHSFETHLKAAAFALLEARQHPRSTNQYTLVPVGADWTGNENILGYPDGLDPTRYVAKPALQLMLNAAAQPDLPHFLILDEMNLSHVERYFADILSAIESGEPIPLYEGPERFLDKDRKQAVPGKLTLPDNLFIIGTVNVDETTYMFSPKVLDRANVIEFRMDSTELGEFLKDPKKPDIKDLNGQGAEYGPAFVEAARSKVDVPVEAKVLFELEMMLLFQVLQEHGAEFGYRVAHESARFLHFYRELGGFAEADETRAKERLGEWFDDAMDAVIVQKLLPKLHGSRGRLEGLLWALGVVCAWDRSEWEPRDQAAGLLALCKEAGLADDEAKYAPGALQKQLRAAGREARYRTSFDKILRMQRKLERDQFVSFAEA